VEALADYINHACSVSNLRMVWKIHPHFETRWVQVKALCLGRLGLTEVWQQPHFSELAFVADRQLRTAEWVRHSLVV